MRREVVIAGIALLSVVALAGWTRKPAASPANTQACEQPAAAYPATPVNYAQPDPYGYPGAAPYGMAAVPVMYVPMQPAAQQPVAVQPQAGYADYRQPAPAPVRRTVAARRYVEPARTVQVKRTRPTSHSVAIVAGSSGVGAAVGALAGGGKGAAIGALAGGAGGFIYDRITRNR